MNGTVSVRRDRRFVSQELQSSRVEQVNLVDERTIDVGGRTFHIDSTGHADVFVAAVRAEATERARAAETAEAAAAAASLAASTELTERLDPNGDRWQYAVVNTGALNTSTRLTNVLSATGQAGWELVTIYDKSSNWFAGIENGFMLLRRRVPRGVEPESWAIQYRA
ncbi:MAG: hypothetical protein R2754_07320 [Microthrixaceae bacterium]